MALKSVQIPVTTVAVRILGSGSTNIDTAGASPYDILHMDAQVMVGNRVWLSRTSAGTTADSFNLPAFSIEHFEINYPWGVFAFSSAGTTSRIALTGGKQ